MTLLLMPKIGRFFACKYRFPRRVYALIQARDFEQAHEELGAHAADGGRDGDYYKCCAKIAALEENYEYAIELYEQSIHAGGSGTQRFLVYADVIRLLYLAGRESDAQQFIDSALEDLVRVVRRPVFTAQSLVNLSKFVIRLGLAELYVEILTTKWCWNPWQKKLKVAKQALSKHRETFTKLSALQANRGYTLGSLKSPSALRVGSVDVVVYWPMGYLSLLLRDFEGVYDLFNSILCYLEQKNVRFVLKNQYLLNRCPDLDGLKVLSWHTCGCVAGVRHLKESPFSGFFYFDRTGYSGWAAITALTDEQINATLTKISDLEAEDYFQALVTRFITARKSKYDQVGQVCVPLPIRYVFIPMQLLDDHVTKLTDWDIFHLISEVLRLLEGTDVSLVVKRHPKCSHWRVDALLAEMAAHPRVLLVDAPIHDLIESSSAVCTVNSGVGAEALLMCKPVFTASLTDYGFLAHDIRSVQSSPEFIALTEVEVDRVKYAKFMTYYCRDYLVDGADPVAIEQHVDLWLNAAC